MMLNISNIEIPFSSKEEIKVLHSTEKCKLYWNFIEKNKLINLDNDSKICQCYYEEIS